MVRSHILQNLLNLLYSYYVLKRFSSISFCNASKIIFYFTLCSSSSSLHCRASSLLPSQRYHDFWFSPSSMKSASVTVDKNEDSDGEDDTMLYFLSLQYICIHTHVIIDIFTTIAFTNTLYYTNCSWWKWRYINFFTIFFILHAYNAFSSIQLYQLLSNSKRTVLYF